MTPQPASVSVTLPITPALDRVKRVLFRPFDPAKWFTIGFCAWLAYLGQAGTGTGYSYHGGPSGGGEDLSHAVGRARDFVMHNLSWLLPLAATLLIVGLVVGILIVWLSSRGRFMFLHCVALDKAEISEPWKQFVREGNSLFWFRLGIGLIGLVLVVPLLVLAGVTVYRLLEHDTSWLVSVGQLAGTGLVLLGLAIVLALIEKFTTDFVVPIMFLRSSGCVAAWRELLALMSANAGRFALYVLFQIVLAIVIGAIVLGVVVATCCIAGCLLLIPYLGTVVLLPILVFKRSYALYYLAQYGPELDVFPPPAPPITDAPPPVI